MDQVCTWRASVSTSCAEYCGGYLRESEMLKLPPDQNGQSSLVLFKSGYGENGMIKITKRKRRYNLVY